MTFTWNPLWIVEKYKTPKIMYDKNISWIYLIIGKYFGPGRACEHRQRLPGRRLDRPGAGARLAAPGPRTCVWGLDIGLAVSNHVLRVHEAPRPKSEAPPSFLLPPPHWARALSGARRPRRWRRSSRGRTARRRCTSPRPRSRTAHTSVRQAHLVLAYCLWPWPRRRSHCPR
jgi:hypothetical protein